MPEDFLPLVTSIPPGRVASYGAVGRQLEAPASGWQVGRWMAICPDGTPWWRVVGKDGGMCTANRDPRLADEQRRLLKEEGVAIEDDRVRMDLHAMDW